MTIQWTCIETSKTVKIPENLASQARFAVTLKTPRTYIFQIEATNSKGLTAIAQTQVGVKGIDKGKPTAVIAGPERAIQGATITLSGAGSTSPNGKIQSYRWADVSDGGALIKDPVPATRKSEWTFKAADPGRYIVSLVVSDDKYDSEPVKYIVDVGRGACTRA